MKDKIVVGMSRSLSGPIAIIDDSAFRPVYETWVKEVNAAGGINVGGKKMLIELKIYDDKSDLATMAQLTEKLILEDKVDFVWGGGGTSFIYAQAPIANKYEYSVDNDGRRRYNPQRDASQHALCIRNLELLGLV